MCLAAVAAPTARADAVDDNFLTALKARGINFASARAAIMAGHAVCDELDGGRQLSDVASDVMKNSNLDGYHAGFSSEQALARSARGTTCRRADATDICCICCTEPLGHRDHRLVATQR